jgi:glycosyltransferase involved in cell wall biosynthesis
VSTSPSVGVVVPVRDGAAHLAAALGSVLSQVPPPVDVVVVDGGSTDGSAELAAAHAGVRVVAQSGIGLSQARNQGMAEVLGDVICFCDADDRWPEGSLAARLEALGPDVDVVVGQVSTEALAGEVVPDHRVADLGRPTRGWTPGAVLVRREAAEAVGGFDEALTIGGDHDWLVRLTQAAPAVARVDEVVLRKGLRDDSLSTGVEEYREELLQVAWGFVRRHRAGAEADAEVRQPARPAGHLEVVHVVPRMFGGGPERGVLVQAGEARAAGRDERHTAIVLEGPASPLLLLKARRAGLDVLLAPEDDEVDRLVAAADLVLVHWWNFPAGRRLLSRHLPACRLVVWCHVLGLHPAQVLTADVAEVADHVLLTSERSRDSELARAAAARDVPTDVARAPVDFDRLDGFTPRPHAGVRIGYVGLVNDTKLDPAFAAMCAQVAHPDVTFVVAGGGGGEQVLRDRFAALGMADRAEVLGPTDDVRSVLEGLDVFVSPLIPDTYATAEATLQEAMWVGLPVVVFRDRGGAWPAVEHEVTGLLADSEAEMVAALDRLAADAELRARLGAAARTAARARFDPDRQREALTRVIDATIARPKRAHQPLPGGDDGAGQAFVRALGEQAGPFATSLAGVGASASVAEVVAADQEIAASTGLIVQGDGGIVHCRNEAPDDPHLRWWSGLVLEAAGRLEVAASEYEAAEALGLTDGRPAARRRAILPG